MAKSTRPQDRRAEMEALQERLAAQVEQLRSSEQWLTYLKFCRAFHRYSLSNLLLIWSQAPQASQVAGYRTWQKLGRQVRKGERGIRIIGTGTVNVEQEDEETGEATAGKRRVFFPVSVFDVAQTELTEGRQDASTVTQHLTGADEAGIYATVKAHLTGQGVEVRREHVTNGANGYTLRRDESGLLVVVDEALSPAQAAKTALHEAAHIALGHLEDDYAEYVAHRGRYEVEAESVAFVLAGLLGLDASAYSTGYVATWAEQAQGDTVRETASRVLAAAHQLAAALLDDQEGCADNQAAQPDASLTN